jgi:hypothetical protein
MTEIGERVDLIGHGSCVVLDMFVNGKGFTGKEKWSVSVFVEKVGACDTVPSTVLKARNAFRPPLGKTLDELGETIEEARFRVWAIQMLRNRYRGDYETGMIDAVAKLEQFSPEEARSIPVPRGLNKRLQEAREMYMRGSINGSDLARAQDAAFTDALKQAEQEVEAALPSLDGDEPLQQATEPPDSGVPEAEFESE